MRAFTSLDPTALPWEELADGRPRRLKRGKHYAGDARMVERAARAAASEMGKGVVTTVERLAKWEYVWVQFADQSLELGDPCRCGGRVFGRFHASFAHCEACGAKTLLREPKQQLRAPPPGGPGGAGLDPGAATFGTVLSVRLLSAEGKETDEIPIDEESVIEGTFHAPQAPLAISPRVIVRTDVVRAFAASPPGYRLIEHPGVYRVEMRIPPDLLAAQAYAVDFRMFVQPPGGGERLLSGARLPFTAYDPAAEGIGREGVVRPRFDWAIRGEDGTEPPELHTEETAREPLDPDDDIPGEA